MYVCMYAFSLSRISHTRASSCAIPITHACIHTYIHICTCSRSRVFAICLCEFRYARAFPPATAVFFNCNYTCVYTCMYIHTLSHTTRILSNSQLCMWVYLFSMCIHTLSHATRILSALLPSRGTLSSCERFVRASDMPPSPLSCACVCMCVCVRMCAC